MECSCAIEVETHDPAAVVDVEGSGSHRAGEGDGVEVIVALYVVLHEADDCSAGLPSM